MSEPIRECNHVRPSNTSASDYLCTICGKKYKPEDEKELAIIISERGDRGTFNSYTDVIQKKYYNMAKRVLKAGYSRTLPKQEPIATIRDRDEFIEELNKIIDFILRHYAQPKQEDKLDDGGYFGTHCHICHEAVGICKCVKQSDKGMVPLDKELREYLWLSHGHTGQYGDDGEMQCQACCVYGCTDYKREPLEKVIETTIIARRDVNISKFARPATPSENDIYEILENKIPDYDHVYLRDLAGKLRSLLSGEGRK